MASAFNALFSFLTGILKWTLDGIVWLLKSVFFLIFDGVLTVISALFHAIDLSAFLSSYALNWAGLPPQMIWFINSVAIPQGITILAAAITIRMALNLIPAAFTRI